MKISTKGRYAVRLMVDLAQNSTGTNVSLKDVAKRQNLSVKYLEQIITLLTKSGYVISTRGANGGYRLSQKPENYTVGMILRLTEGSLAPVACVEDDVNECPRKDDCCTIFVWKKLYKAICDVVDSITIADIVNMGADNYII